LIFRGPILRVVLAAALYITLCVFIFGLIGLWNSDDIGVTIAWALLSAFVSIISFQRAVEEKLYFKRSIIELFGFTTLFVFFVDQLNISIWFWLIVVPILTIIQLGSETSRGDPDSELVKKLLDNTLGCFGLIILLFAIWQIIALRETIFTIQTLKNFILPTSLSIAFLPFIYALTVYSAYESVFGNLKVIIEDKKLRRYAKWRALLSFRHDLDFLDRWRKSIGRSSPNSKEAVKETLIQMQQIKAREQNPPPVDEQEGWQPIKATRFLEGVGLGTRDYHHSFENEWFASSDYLEIGDGFLTNDIAFYIEGSATTAKVLKLKLSVNHPDDASEAISYFIRIGRLLIVSAIPDIDADDILSETEPLNPFIKEGGSTKIALERDDWVARMDGGHSFTLILRRPYIE
jgi:hypothetical protein